MAFEEIISDGEDGGYWNPVTVGQSIEGNLKEFETDNWGKKRIVLEKEDEEEVRLPGHADLQQYTKKLEIGDYIKVTLIKIKESNDPDYNDKPFYKVEVDSDKKVVYEEVEE